MESQVDSQAREGARILVKDCGCLKPDESVVVIVDETTESVGELITEEVKAITENVIQVTEKVARMHGEEPSPETAEMMLKADLIFGLTKFSYCHTQARSKATELGARYLSLPYYTMELLMSPALRVDYRTQAQHARKLKEILDQGKTIHITTKKGTDLYLDISGRTANEAPGFCDRPGMLGSPPDIETNVPPVEDKSRGTILVDGSIPCQELGLLDGKIEVKLEGGAISQIDTKTQEGMILHKLMGSKHNPKTKILGEFGIGLNPKAKLSGSMLEDEGCYGTVHFGFGSNITFGGKNQIDFHLDFIVKNPSISVDGNPIMSEGKLL